MDPGAAAMPLLEMLSELGGAGDLLEEFEKGRIPILEQSAPMEQFWKQGNVVMLRRLL